MQGVRAWKRSCVGLQAHVPGSPGFLLLSSCLCLNVHLSHSKLTCTEKLKAWGCEEEEAGE